MDLGRIKAHGRSSTGKAWLTNPLRSVLWLLTAPYFQGTGAEIEQRLQEIEQRLRGFAAGIGQGRVDSYLAGARKDTLALAHRLAGLEDEAATAEQVRKALCERIGTAETEAHDAAAYVASLQQDVRSSVQALCERIGTAETEAHEAAACVASLHQDVRSSVQALGERIGTVETEAHEAAAHVASLHQDVRSSVQALGERIGTVEAKAHEAAAHVAPLHQDTLVLATTSAGAHFLVRQHDLIGHLVAQGQEWEPHVRIAIERTARLDGVAVDAGAYIGLHTVTMSHTFGTVHAFEPQLGIYQLLRANLALNDSTNVVTHNLALYDRAGPMRLAPQNRQEVPTPMRDGHPDYARITNAAALTFEVTDEGGGEVRAVALDDLALEGVALIKVDTQGADLRVLRGAEDTIRRCRPVILFEWERDLGLQHGTTLDAYHTFFVGMDYDVAVLQETSPGRQADYIARPR